MNTSLVSVIIPVYNRKDLIARAVASVINQTYPHWELHIVDDGSTDGTSSKILSDLEGWNRELSPKVGRFYTTIQIHQIEHVGVSGARNYGIEKAVGEWICFLDSDDEWYPDKLKRQMEYHYEFPEIHFSQTKEIWNRKGNLIQPSGKHAKLNGNYLKKSLERCMVTNSSFMGRRNVLQRLGGFREELQTCEDYDLWNRIFLQGDSIGLLDEFLMVRYGGHSDQLSMQYPAMERFRLYSLLLTREEWKEKGKWLVLDENQKVIWERAIRDRFFTLIQGKKKRGQDLSYLSKIQTFFEEGGPLSQKDLHPLLHDAFLMTHI